LPVYILSKDSVDYSTESFFYVQKIDTNDIIKTIRQLMRCFNVKEYDFS